MRATQLETSAELLRTEVTGIPHLPNRVAFISRVSFLEGGHITAHILDRSISHLVLLDSGGAGSWIPAASDTSPTQSCHARLVLH
ncbi:hypothetical protein DPEC_G00073820 [Dallia pectoralis]|uniref:Uncharacterized protein n=1 Tax=Dallia pectoralis TaxID=75939 RepID=A0ACC2H3H9_DALPE|nr:hypothetical protein DPEC_G00073820 [Dallia pectoralis]